MKSVHINGDAVTTGDELADGLMEYALALSRECRVELAILPVIDRSGAIQQARLLVGTGLPLWTLSVDHNGTAELKDPGALEELHRRTAQLELEWLLPQN